GLILNTPENVQIGDTVQVSLFRGDDERILPANVQFVQDNRVGLRFRDLSIQQQTELAQMTFGQADIWAAIWHASVPDAPFTAIKQIGSIGLRGFFVLFRETGRELGKGAVKLTRRGAQQI